MAADILKVLLQQFVIPYLTISQESLLQYLLESLQSQTTQFQSLQVIYSSTLV